MLKMQSLSRRLSLFQTLISVNSRVKNTQKFYCTNQIVINSSRGGNQSNREGEEIRKKEKKETLYSRISPLGNPKTKIGPVLDQWVESGQKVRFAELRRIIHDLRKRSRFSHALQVCEWMKKSGMFTYSPTEHAVQLDLIGRVHGYLSAENYFTDLSEEDKTEKTYGALLHSYARQRQSDKSLSLLQMMKEKGLSLSSVAYNDIMLLYTKVAQHEKVPDVLIQMQDNGVSPDNLSYRLCINSFGVRSDMDGIKNVLREMEYQPNISMDWNTYAVVANFYIKEGLKDEANSYLQRAEKILDNNDTEGYNHLISLHANLGNKAQVFRLWALEKNTFKKRINKDYLNMLKSLVRIDEFESALECLKEWESSGNCYDFRVPNTIILGYIEKGLCEKAEAMLKGLMGEGKAHMPESWGRLSAGYLHKDEMEKAVECMKVALSFCGERKGWKPDPSVLTKLNNFLGDKGSMEDTEALIRA
ncbi:pentatricopeptide repeat-containing protein At4g21705, mitochondrial [Coffea arabica]|uniref:Pentatricopeptide repeat-containing protein At4g21705, mitochondrial n=1 Tax=Coffea arabica TaxID=13443 RepID=A0A6P6W9R2_COFAR|nr:pentatricopeptide repeat-containing protein At4g21705, mitochondrial-like [Coffea arabica]